jgi:hypothetical protein
MDRNARSHRRSALVIVAIACGCSGNVQDLGRSDPVTAPSSSVTPRPSPGLEGTVTLDAPTRDLACPLSRPIEGDDCGLENGGPCTYVGGPEAPPDQAATPIDSTTTFCICTAEHRWACLQGVTMKTLVTPLNAGDRCENGLVVERAGTTCRCISGVARCEP